VSSPLSVNHDRCLKVDAPDLELLILFALASAHGGRLIRTPDLEPVSSDQSVTRGQTHRLKFDKSARLAQNSAAGTERCVLAPTCRRLRRYAVAAKDD
jgi:hypothetical protein